MSTETSHVRCLLLSVSDVYLLHGKIITDDECHGWLVKKCQQPQMARYVKSYKLIFIWENILVEFQRETNIAEIPFRRKFEHLTKINISPYRIAVNANSVIVQCRQLFKYLPKLEQPWQWIYPFDSSPLGSKLLDVRFAILTAQFGVGLARPALRRSFTC